MNGHAFRQGRVDESQFLAHCVGYGYGVGLRLSYDRDADSVLTVVTNNCVNVDYPSFDTRDIAQSYRLAAFVDNYHTIEFFERINPAVQSHSELPHL